MSRTFAKYTALRTSASPRLANHASPKNHDEIASGPGSNHITLR